MNYVYFDDPLREYDITNPCTPTRWINCVGTLDFDRFVVHTDGAQPKRLAPHFPADFGGVGDATM
jgi:hypothetical protein